MGAIGIGISDIFTKVGIAGVPGEYGCVLSDEAGNPILDESGNEILIAPLNGIITSGDGDYVLVSGGDSCSFISRSGEIYEEKVLGIQEESLIAYWPLYEESGLVADNLEGTAALDGSYENGLDIGNHPSASPGYQAPYFSYSDYVDVFSAGLASAFDMEEGSLLIWAGTREKEQFTTTRHIVCEIGINSSNRMMIRWDASYELDFRFIGGGTEKSVSVTSIRTTGWIPLAITWSKAANEVKFFVDGAQVGATQTYPQWVGTLAYADIGSNVGQSLLFTGYLSHVALWSGPLGTDDVADLADVVGSPQGWLSDFYRIKTVADCDFIAMADIDGDGAQDIVSGRSTTSAVYWFENGEAADGKTWTEHTIDATAGTKLEGATAGDFNGDGEIEVIILDQTEGKIRLYKPTVFGTPTGAWDKVELQTGRTKLQDAVAWDIDGDGRPEIVYSWEGGTGGIHWLDWDSGDPTNPANWTDYQMVARSGAWWIARTRVDLSGDGNATDIVFGARGSGIYWLEEPAVVTNTWAETTIDTMSSGGGHVDVGDFSGDGTGKDVIAPNSDYANSLGIYRHSDGWSRTDVPHAVATGVWNVRTLPGIWSRNGKRSFIVAHYTADLYYYFWNGVSWEGVPLSYGFSIHPADDDIVFLDVDGDGIEELVIPDSDSGNGKLIWIKPVYE